jgi:signal transduction histidine kinase
MLYLVNDILDFSQIQNNSIMISKEWIDIRQLIQKSREILIYLAEAKSIPIIIEVDP